MSLEQTLQETNTLLKQVITILQTGVSAGAEIAGKPDAKTTKKADAKPGAEAKTVYWLIEKHNTVLQQNPGDPAPTVEGAKQVSKEVYDAKKAEFAALTEAAISRANTANSQRTAEAGAGDAQGKKPETQESNASTATDAGASSATSDVDLKTVVEALTELNTSTKEGHGRAAVMGILKQFMPKAERPTVPQLAELKKNAEILAEVNKLLGKDAQPAGGADDYDPLG